MSQKNDPSCIPSSSGGEKENQNGRSGTLRRLHQEIEAHLPRIDDILRERMGDSFGAYKISLQARRIERRMAFNRLNDIEEYLRLLRENPAEGKALARDFLIGVTAFFRDRSAFEILEQDVIPELLKERRPDEPVRVWVAGCASGEEAYSLAILFREAAEKMADPPAVQIFASDLDTEAVHDARSGFYPERIRSEITEERLRRFFTWQNGRFQVNRDLREMVVFAAHNLLRDPPFSRLDLLCCRNLLIYFEAVIQERLLPVFHHALRPEGFLFLGSAESIGNYSDLFAPVDKKWRIFRRREGARPTARIEPYQLSGLTRFLEGTGRPSPGKIDVGAVAEKTVVERFAPPCVLINEKGEALHFYSRISRYLEQPVGESTFDILKMAHSDLRPSLRAAIHRAYAEGVPAEFRSVRMGLPSGEEWVDLWVEPLQEPSPLRGLALVVFRPSPTPPAPAEKRSELAGESLVRHLEEQLQITSDQLQNTLRDYERTNEELQSTNEELETGKEELQALNEELVTLNAELESKVEELARTNDDMENLLASSQIATVFLDRDFRVKRFTPAAADLLGLRAGDAGREVPAIPALVTDEQLPADVRTVLLRLHHIEREVTTADGRVLLLRILPYRTRNEVIEGVVLTFTDVTRLKSVETELARQREEAERRAREAEEGERLLEAIMEHIPMGLTVADAPDVNIRMVSHFGRELTRRPAEKIEGIPVDQHAENWGLYHLDGTPASNEELPLTRATRTGEVVRNEELILQRPDGSQIIVLCNAAPIRDRRGRIVGGLIAWQDISERKRLEENLRAGEERLRLALTAGRMGVWDYDLSSGKVKWDGAQFELFGVVAEGAEEIPAERIFSLIHPDERRGVLDDLRSLQEGSESYSNEFRVLMRDGSLRWLAARGQAVLNGAGETTRIIGVNWDVTEHKEAEQALEEREEILRAAKEAAEAGNRAKSEFLANMSHEIRTPMTVIMAALEHLMEGEEISERRSILEMADDAAERLLGIINDILDISRIEARKLVIETEPFDLRESVAKALNIFRLKAGNKGLVLRSEVDPAVPSLVSGDPGRLGQILVNLVGNAVKFTEEGEVLVQVERDPKGVKFTVRDTGIGIATEKMNLLFNSFSQVDASLTRRHGGTGLGLAVSKGLVELMGGEIWAGSVAGEGSIFAFRLPLREAGTLPEDEPSPSSPQALPQRTGILLAEDDPMVRELIVMILKRREWGVTTAGTGKEALELWREKKPALILMDVQMPEMDGLEATRAIRAEEHRSGSPPTPILALTAHARREDREECLAAGMDGCLTKPISMDQLYAAIEEKMGSGDRNG